MDVYVHVCRNVALAKKKKGCGWVAVAVAVVKKWQWM
jgi:hypothetical protein